MSYNLSDILLRQFLVGGSTHILHLTILRIREWWLTFLTNLSCQMFEHVLHMLRTYHFHINDHACQSWKCTAPTGPRTCLQLAVSHTKRESPYTPDLLQSVEPTFQERETKTLQELRPSSSADSIVPSEGCLCFSAPHPGWEQFHSQQLRDFFPYVLSLSLCL